MFNEMRNYLIHVLTGHWMHRRQLLKNVPIACLSSIEWHVPASWVCTTRKWGKGGKVAWTDVTLQALPTESAHLKELPFNTGFEIQSQARPNLSVAILFRTNKARKRFNNIFGEMETQALRSKTMCPFIWKQAGLENVMNVMWKGKAVFKI